MFWWPVWCWKSHQTHDCAQGPGCCCCSDPELHLEGQTEGQQALSGAGDTTDPNSTWSHLVLRGWNSHTLRKFHLLHRSDSRSGSCHLLPTPSHSLVHLKPVLSWLGSHNSSSQARSGQTGTSREGQASGRWTANTGAQPTTKTLHTHHQPSVQPLKRQRARGDGAEIPGNTATIPVFLLYFGRGRIILFELPKWGRNQHLFRFNSLGLTASAPALSRRLGKVSSFYSKALPSRRAFQQRLAEHLTDI